MSEYSLSERLQSVYEYWNADYSDGLPEGAGVLLEAAAALRELEAEVRRLRGAVSWGVGRLLDADDGEGSTALLQMKYPPGRTVKCNSRLDVSDG